MPTRTPGKRNTTRGSGSRVYIRPPRKGDAESFLAAVSASRSLHRGWVRPPASPTRFDSYVTLFNGPKSRNATATHAGFVVCRREDNALVGVFNLSEIVRGSFQSAYLGYYGFVPYIGEGYMRDALDLVLKTAFRTLKLHRLEANIQPDNERSIALVRSAGFTREGFSRRYIKIGGRWRDHERWAMLAEGLAGLVRWDFGAAPARTAASPVSASP